MDLIPRQRIIIMRTRQLRFNSRQQQQFLRRFRVLYCFAILVFSALLLLACAIAGVSSYVELSITNPCSLKQKGLVKFSKDIKETTLDLQQQRHENGALDYRIGGRRYLSGPGSSPPRCTSKCGKCTPCKPVHVPVPPGTPVTAEYYPEAWRCKCGNKLYMP